MIQENVYYQILPLSFTRYQLSVEKSERLTGTWTLEQYERCYERAFYNIVKAAILTGNRGRDLTPASWTA